MSASSSRAPPILTGDPMGDAEAALCWVEETYGDGAAIATSFGAEDVVLLELASRLAPSAAIFTLDTGRLPPETYEVMESWRARLTRPILTYHPRGEELEALTRDHGFFSFRDSLEARHACCAIRKLEPLRRALTGRRAWVTGLRREQAPSRSGVALLEEDALHAGLPKVNPLAEWTEAQVWRYIADRKLPYNRLHDLGYRSIGCAPCTRAVRPFEDVRAGRWWWERPEAKECGLHGGRR